jgi:hypothetical protein
VVVTDWVVATPSQIYPDPLRAITVKVKVPGTVTPLEAEVTVVVVVVMAT